nr:septum site-determining protein MinC [uncultured Bacillus sp.]
MIKNQNVTIKGTKDGLTLHLDHLCSYDELKRELQMKLSETARTQDAEQLLKVKVQAGYRYLSEEQKEEIMEIIRQKKNFIVDSMDSSVMTVEEAVKMKEEQEIVSLTKIVRSGQVIKVPGDLLLIGDVNPGGTIMAGGNIFVMGALKGVAHAGCNGNKEAVVAAAIMIPSQIRIAEYINRAPDFDKEQEKREMECAYIDENNQIIIDRLQVLMQLRPNLTKLEGGL